MGAGPIHVRVTPAVIPAKAGIQGVTPRIWNEPNLDPRLRGGDDSAPLCHSRVTAMRVTAMDDEENTAAYHSIIPA